MTGAPSLQTISKNNWTSTSVEPACPRSFERAPRSLAAPPTSVLSQIYTFIIYISKSQIYRNTERRDTDPAYADSKGISQSPATWQSSVCNSSLIQLYILSGGSYLVTS